jgi:hypothetical protein
MILNVYTGILRGLLIVFLVGWGYWYDRLVLVAYRAFTGLGAVVGESWYGMVSFLVGCIWDIKVNYRC